MIGKSICKYLKSVRRAVAEANGIDLEIPECTFEGECSGTCCWMRKRNVLSLPCLRGTPPL